MNTSEIQGVCPLYGGPKEEGKTTFTSDFGTGVVVIRDVPAIICSQCGTDWITDESDQKIEKIVSEAKKKHNYVEIVSLSA